MDLNLRKFFVAWKRILVIAAAILGVYVLYVAGSVLWAFEFKLKRWPILVHGAPVNTRVGDDIRRIQLLERLERLGYVRASGNVPEVGEYVQSPTSLDVHFKHCPLAGEGIISGPVSFTIDASRIRAIHLMRSLKDVGQITIEPELLSVIPASGWGQDLCRPVSLEECPDLLKDAIILTEDRHFLSHSGIDITSIIRALEANIKAWRYLQGGSTITQQLMKMTLLSPRKTIPRKIHEIALALATELLYSKDTILEAYLNRLYFGQWGQFPLRGVDAAASHLFGKSLRQLDPAECALLAAVIRAPNILTPFRHPERALARRNMVLGLLFKEGKISRDDYEHGLDTPVRVRKPGAPPVKAGPFLDLAQDVFADELSRSRSGCPSIMTSLDPVLQHDTYIHVKRLGNLAAESFAVISNPQTGELRAMISPESGKWTGSGGNLETVLPIGLIPALMPQKSAPARFNLTSQVFAPGASLRPGTLREVFREDRPSLMRKLLDTVGHETVVHALREFGINAEQADDEIRVSPLSPLKMAHVYGIMAAGGSAPPVTPRAKIAGEPDTAPPPPKTAVSCGPGPLFLVNHLLRGVQPTPARFVPPERLCLVPSVFVARDGEGTWGIAYRWEELVVIRIPDTKISPGKVRAVLLKALPGLRSDTGSFPSIPEGITFVNICLTSGLRATSICPDVMREPFLKGSQPTEWCPLRHYVKPLRSEHP